MSDDFASLDATAQAELVRHGKASPLELTEAAIRRIERANPAINAVVTEQFERALREARGPLPEGPFRGVPFLIKDLHAADPGVRMTQGSRFLEHYVPDYESELLSRFKRAGLVILGRTNTPEFGIPPTTEPVLFGPCKNPWDPTRSSGGSSGGAAAAVAARLVPMAHASDGGGSIRIPASCCGIFGIKPTRARTPAGPKVGEGTGGLAVQFAVSISVRDSARLLDATAGPAPGDPYHAPHQTRPYTDEVKTRPGRLRIAVMREPWNRASVDAECVHGIDASAALLRELGHDVVDRKLELHDTAGFFSNFITVWAVAAASTLNAAEESVGRAATPEDVEPLTWALCSIGRGRSAVDYLSAMRALHRAAREVAAFFTDFDVLVTPTLAKPPVKLGELDCPANEPLRGFIKAGDYAAFTALFNVTGQPAMSVPLHFSESGLPIGTQFVGRFGDEATLFRLAGEIERARPWAARIPPLAANGTASRSP
jgi:amidase